MGASCPWSTVFFQRMSQRPICAIPGEKRSEVVKKKKEVFSFSILNFSPQNKRLEPEHGGPVGNSEIPNLETHHFQVADLP